MLNKNRSPLGLYMIGIVALFLAGSLMLVVLGAHTYRNAVRGQEANNKTRAICAYLSAALHAGDGRDRIQIKDNTDGSSILVIRDDGGYASRIYLHEGALVEDYGKEEAPLDPADAMVIGQTKGFQANLDKETGVLRIDTDEGYTLVHIRSGGGETP